MSRARRDAPPRGVPVLVDDELAARRLRQRAHIAASIADRDRDVSRAAATCTPEALADNLRLSIVLAHGPTCPTCGTPWADHRSELRAHLDAVLGVNPSPTSNGAA